MFEESKFIEFSQAVRARFNNLSKHELFVVDIGGVDLFDEYLKAFPPGTNPMFREKTDHDCNCCKNYIRHLGHVVAVIDGKVCTMWEDLGLIPEMYEVVALRLDMLVRSFPIKTIFRSAEKEFGKVFSYDTKSTQRWSHFYGAVASRHQSSDVGKVRSVFESSAQVFKRGLEELKPEAVETVLDLINSNAIYRGDEHKRTVMAFRERQQAFLAAPHKDLFALTNVEGQGGAITRFRNTAIGTLVVDISEGIDVEQAVKSFEAKVAPQNYQRPTSVITQGMVDKAVATITELGLDGALDRRFARLSDVGVQNVLWVDNNVKGKLKGGFAALLSEEVATPIIKLDHAEVISVEDFIANVLPGARSVDVLVENRHIGNFVSLTAPADPHGVGRLFKWANDFAWSYDGEVADSIKARVKKAGGNVDAKLRVSLGWFNYDDLDIHCEDPRGTHIFFRNKCGILDVDMNAPGGPRSREAVENLAWNDRYLVDGIYKVWVHQFNRAESVDIGFNIEIEFGGVTRQFAYEKGVGQNDQVKCFAFRILKGQLAELQVDGALTEKSPSQAKWNVQTETLIPVDTMLLSPNYWDGQGVGNKHLFFMLRGCKNPEATRGMYNEFLRPDLYEHRKVFEVLGGKMKCPPAEDQLSGVGYSSTNHDTVKVVVKGAKSKAYQINF